MALNLSNLPKDQIIWLYRHYCKHGIRYIQHPNCYLKEEHVEERIGFLDIEGSNLDADFGYIFSYAIKELDGKILGRVLEQQEIRQYIFDRKLMREFCRDIRLFDKVVVHWGTDRRHDLPFLRTRCLKHGLNFPEYGEVFAQDTYPMARNKLKLSGNRLEKICVFLGIPAKGHKLDPEIWQKALAGHPASLKYIWTHNIEDVVSLEEVWKKLHVFVPNRKSSI